MSNTTDSNSGSVTGPALMNSEESQQWQNPEDVLSLLLLIGGETVQQAIVQLNGFRIVVNGPPFDDDKNQRGFNLTPVAFSFG